MPRLSIGLEQVFTSLGIVGNGYKLFFFDTETMIPKTTYSDEDLTVPNTNPIVLNSAGRPDVGIWGMDPSLYRMILGTPDSVLGNITTVVDVDPVDNYSVNNIAGLTPIPTAYWGTTAGTSTNYTLDPALVDITSYSNEQTFFIDFHIACANNPTININDLGALNLKKYNNQGIKVNPVAGDIQPQRYLLINDGADVAVLSIGTPGSSWRGVNYLSNFPTTIANGTDTEHDINFGAAPFNFSDGSGSAYGSAITKRADATWALGDNNGGMASGQSLPTSGTVHFFRLSSANGGVVDAGFDTSPVAANLLADSAVVSAGITKYLRIASARTDSSANFLNGTYYFNPDGAYRFVYNSLILDVNVTNPGTSAVTPSVSTPSGIITDWDGLVSLFDATPDSGSVWFGLVTSPAQTNAVPSTTNFNLIMDFTNATGADFTANQNFILPTNTSNQIRYRLSLSDADISVKVFTSGWYDTKVN